METVATSLEEELAESTHWSENRPPDIEEQDLDRLAFELWRRANSVENLEEELMSEDEALRCHASCL
jgi:hypothetical protein